MLIFCVTAIATSFTVLQHVDGAFSTDSAVSRPVSPLQWAWSDSICTGLQLANFWQDVARDADMGRCYIPKDVAKRFDVDVENLCENAAFKNMLAELVEDARNRLLAGRPLVNSVPKPARLDISLFIHGGLAILDAIEQGGYRVLSKRPRVSRGKKWRLFVRAVAAMLSNSLAR